MAPLGYFYSGEQFAETPASPALRDEVADGIARVPHAIGASHRGTVAAAVAFVVALGAGSDATGQPIGAAPESFAPPAIHAPLAITYVSSGDVLPGGAAPSIVESEYDGLVRFVARQRVPAQPPITDTPALPAAAAQIQEYGHVPIPLPQARAVARVFDDTPQLVEQPPAGSIAADETGYLPPVPALPGPVVTVFRATDELVEQPTPAAENEGYSATIVHAPVAIGHQQSGDVLPGGAAPSAPPADAADLGPLTDPVVVEPTPTVFFWIDHVLPGAVAPTPPVDTAHVMAFVAPVVVTTTDARAFTDQEVLPGAVAPSQIVDANDPLALTDPVVVGTLDARVFTDDEVLPITVAPTMVDQIDDPLALTDPVVVGTTTYARAWTGADATVLPSTAELTAAAYYILPKTDTVKVLSMTGEHRITGATDRVRILRRT